MPAEAGAFARALAQRELRHFTRVEYHETTRSTNADALSKLEAPGSGGLTLVAGVQTAGAGRRGSRWVAPPGTSLLFTAILPLPIAASAAWAVPFWAGLCLADALERESGVRATLQWPNDLLVGGRKISGILCISRITGDRAWIGIGVGVNVHRPANDAALLEIVPLPVFLDDVADVKSDARPRLLAAILERFDHDLGALSDSGQVARRWERAAGLPNVPYRFVLDEGAQVEGNPLRLESGGALLVRTADGERRVELATARVLR
ncbi:MAG: biotin--[acetyl-CoA-carboxylase] ligase [Candidatus Eremiobacteraeota bacterium]|nr:biotin--[acetyl-CoA-carboxylase] ligase [Candidatus Eremiobacteraeota bacterium]MBV8354324.1 biotin--[acetyl-CoA-carboxylase] ligase [Candidatus Eremiobacteraeota bacterium]